MIEQVMQVCGCSREAAERAVEAAGPGGVDLAVDFVLSTMSTHTSLPSGFDAPPQPAKLVCLVRKDLGMGTGKVAAQAITERASEWDTRECLRPAASLAGGARGSSRVPLGGAATGRGRRFGALPLVGGGWRADGCPGCGR